MSIRSRLATERASWPLSVRDSALAEAAELAAGMLDWASGDIGGSVRDTAALLKELRATMSELRALAYATPDGQEDPVERLEGAGPSNVLEFRDRGGPRKTS